MDSLPSSGDVNSSNFYNNHNSNIEYDSDGDIPPIYSENEGQERIDGNPLEAYDYTSYNTTLLDNEMDQLDNSNYTYGSTDIIVGTNSPTKVISEQPRPVSSGFSHPAAEELAQSLMITTNALETQQGLKIVNMSNYDGDFMAEDEQEGVSTLLEPHSDPECEIEDSERNTQLAAAIAAGSALSAVRSRSQGNPIDELDSSGII